MVKKILELPNDSLQKTLFVATAVCLVCAVVVSVAAVALKPMQEENKALDKKLNIVKIAGIYRDGDDVNKLFENIEARVVDLDTGEYASDIDAATYDQRKASKDPAMSRALSPDEDIASIKRREKYATVYLVKKDDAVSSILLPVHGSGLWSTLYGFVAIKPDANTISGFGFYQHGETPGLGGEVDNPKWKALWPGKKLYAEDGSIAIEVIKGAVNNATPLPEHKVDGLAGATLTSNGVKYLVQYWVGEQGFQKYLNKIKQEG